MAKSPATRTTRTRAATRPIDKLREEEEARAPVTREAYAEPVYSDEPPVFTAQGCLTSFVIVLLLAITGFLLYDKVTEDNQPPAPVPVPGAPVLDLRHLTQPITAKLATDPAKAAIVRDVFRGYADALQGPSRERVATSQIMAAVNTAILSDQKTNVGVPIAGELNAAVSTHLGIKYLPKEGDEDAGWEPRAFTDEDRVKLMQITDAISRAAEEAL